ncbi:hypothetical protein NDU88_001832 [Pleurodeles waltl]|uniref:Uncharacterized protein n=1 Tax=Pleurodeles waltl TaxID=8319 RepID=A0AAV7T161_PLEWA|nr:hypothetical protein NDU88_001832 [Pleurodeles waltl]
MPDDYGPGREWRNAPTAALMQLDQRSAVEAAAKLTASYSEQRLLFLDSGSDGSNSGPNSDSTLDTTLSRVLPQVTLQTADNIQ